MILKENRISSPIHRKFIVEQPCFIDRVWNETVVPHHLLRVGIKGIGTKHCDMWCLPLQDFRHKELHLDGDEISYFESHGYDYEEVKQHCIEFAKISPCKKIRDKVNVLYPD